MTNRRVARRTAIAAPVLALLLLAAGCAGSEGPAVIEGPAGVIQVFYRHLNAGEYDAAYSLYADEATAVVPPPGDSDVLRQWGASETRNGTLDRVVILESTEGPGRMEVSFELRYADGGSVSRTVTLVEQDGEWRMGLVA